ncbi:N-6 DNA methylase, partial [Mariniblastus sp.]|nr:N-6 DNA methylase [Mariniblastus sp.]
MKSKKRLDSLLAINEDQAPSPDSLISAIASMTFLKWIDWYQPEDENGNSQVARFKNLLPENCQWSSVDVSNQKRFFELATNELHELANSNPAANKCSLFHAFAHCLNSASDLENEQLTAIAEWVTELHINEAPSQIKAREEFDKAATLINPEFMDFQTPTTLAWFMAECGEVKANDQVYDPGFGSANLLVAALDDVRQKTEPSTTQTVEKLKIFGVESNPLSFLAGTVRVALSGCYDFEFYLGNCLESSNPFNSREFTLVLSNPPFGSREAKLNLDDFEIKSRNSSNLFCQHAIGKLSDDGRAVLLLPQSIFNRGGADRKLREAILSNNNVRFVADLPTRLFGPKDLIRTSIISIERNGPTKSIRMANAVDAFISQKESKLSELIPSRASDLLARIRDVSQNYDDVRSVDYEQIKELDFVIHPSEQKQSQLAPLLRSLDGEISIVRLGDICQISRGHYREERKPVSPTLSSNSGILNKDHQKKNNSEQSHNQKATDRSASVVSIINGCDLLSTNITKGNQWLRPLDKVSLDSESQLIDQDILIPYVSKLKELDVSVFQKDQFEAVITPSVQRLRLTTNTLDPQYLVAYLQTPEVVQWLDQHSTGFFKLKRIDKRTLNALPVPIVSMDRQKQQTTSIKTLQDLLIAPPSAALLELDNKIVFWARNLANTLNQRSELPGKQLPLYSTPWLQQLNSLSQSNAPVANCENCGRPYVLELTPNEIDSNGHHSAEREATCSQCKIKSEGSTQPQQIHSPAERKMQQRALKSSAVIWALAFRDSM